MLRQIRENTNLTIRKLIRVPLPTTAQSWFLCSKMFRPPVVPSSERYDVLKTQVAYRMSVNGKHIYIYIYILALNNSQLM